MYSNSLSSSIANTVYSVFLHQEIDYELLRNNLYVVLQSLHDIPIYKYIHRGTPVNSLSAQTKPMLWHQLLEDPSDYYLYYAHKFVRGVPKFHHQTAVMGTCPTCSKLSLHQQEIPPLLQLNHTRVFLPISFSPVPNLRTQRGEKPILELTMQLLLLC